MSSVSIASVLLEPIAIPEAFETPSHSKTESKEQPVANPFSTSSHPCDLLLSALFEDGKIDDKAYLKTQELPSLPKIPDPFSQKLENLLEQEVLGISPTLTVRDILKYFFSRGAKLELVGSALQQFLGSEWFVDAVRILSGGKSPTAFIGEHLKFLDQPTNDIDFRVIFKDTIDPVVEAENLIEFLIERQNQDKKDPKLKDLMRSKMKGPFETYNPSMLIDNEKKELKNNAHVLGISTKKFKIDFFVVCNLEDVNVIGSQDLTLDFSSLFSNAEKHFQLKGIRSNGWQCIVDNAAMIIHLLRFNSTAWKKTIVKLSSGYRSIGSLPEHLANGLKSYCKYKGGLFEGVTKLTSQIKEKVDKSDPCAIVTIAFNVGLYLQTLNFLHEEIQKVLEEIYKSFPKVITGNTLSLSQSLRNSKFENLVKLLQLKYWDASQTIIHLGMPCVQLCFDGKYIYIPIRTLPLDALNLGKSPIPILEDFPDRGFSPKPVNQNHLEIATSYLKHPNSVLRSIGFTLQLSHFCQKPSQQLLEELFDCVYEINLFPEERIALARHSSQLLDYDDMDKLTGLFHQGSRESWIIRLANMRDKKFNTIAYKIWKSRSDIKDTRSFYLTIIDANPCLALHMLTEVNRYSISTAEIMIFGERLLHFAEQFISEKKFSEVKYLLLEGAKLKIIHPTAAIWVAFFDLLLSGSQKSSTYLFPALQIAQNQIQFKKEHFKKKIDVLVSVIEILYFSGNEDQCQIGHSFFTLIPTERYYDEFSDRIGKLREKYQEAVLEQEAKQGKIDALIKLIEAGRSPNIKNIIIDVWSELCKKCPLRSAQVGNLNQAKNLLYRIRSYFQDDPGELIKLLKALLEALNDINWDEILPVKHFVLEFSLTYSREYFTEGRTNVAFLNKMIQLIILNGETQFTRSLECELVKFQKLFFEHLKDQNEFQVLVNFVAVYLKRNIEIEDHHFLFNPLMAQITQASNSNHVRPEVYESIVTYSTKILCKGKSALSEIDRMALIPGIVTDLFQKKRSQLAIQWIKYYITLFKLKPSEDFKIILSWAKTLHEKFDYDSIELFRFIESSAESEPLCRDLLSTLEDYSSEWIEENAELCGKVIYKCMPIDPESPLFSKIEKIAQRLLDPQGIELALKLITPSPESSSYENPNITPEFMIRLLDKGQNYNPDVHEKIWKTFLHRFIEICPKRIETVNISQPWSHAWTYHLSYIRKIYDRQRSEYMYRSALSQLSLFTSRNFIFKVDINDPKIFHNIFSFISFFADMPGTLPLFNIEKILAARMRLNSVTNRKHLLMLRKFDLAFLYKSLPVPSGIIFHNSIFMLVKIFENPMEESEDCDQKKIDLVTLAIAQSEKFLQTTYDKNARSACIQLIRLLDQILPQLLKFPPNQKLIETLKNHNGDQLNSPIIPYLDWTFQDPDNLKILEIPPKDTFLKNTVFINRLKFCRAFLLLAMFLSYFAYIYFKDQKKVI